MIFLALALMEIVTAASYPTIKAQFGPWLVGGIIVPLAIVETIRSLRHSATSADEVKSEVVPRRGIFKVLIWLAGLLVLTYFFGMFLGFPLFVLAYMLFNRCNWLLSLSLSIGIFGLLYGIFGRVLSLAFYRGVFL